MDLTTILVFNSIEGLYQTDTLFLFLLKKKNNDKNRFAFINWNEDVWPILVIAKYNKCNEFQW